MRIVFAATGGPLAMESLAAVAAEHCVAAVVRPRRSWRARIAAFTRAKGGAMGRDAVDGWCRSHRVPVVMVSSRRDPALGEALGHYRPELLCIASFPWILPNDVLTLPTAGVVNLHPSLLPRHRGPNPFFWTYYHGDRETGVTVHFATTAVDSGPILAQQRFELPRGFPVEQLYLKTAREGGPLYRMALSELERGTAQPIPQNDSAATRAPRVAPRTSMVNFARWDVERVWHFLAGLYPRFQEPLRDERGRRVRYAAVGGFERGTPTGRPGAVSRAPGGWDLWCLDGRVRLTRAP